MQKVAVAMLDINEVGAHVPGDPGRLDVVFDELLQLAVGPHLGVTGDLKHPVEEWMPIRHARFEAELVVGLTEPTGVRQLKADDQVVGVAAMVLVRGHKGFPELRQAGFVLFIDDELVGIGPAIGAHRHSFATEYELGAALAEALPAAEDVVGEAAKLVCRPSLPWAGRRSGCRCACR